MRWASVCHKLQEHGYQPGDLPDADGSVLEHEDDFYPRIGVWLMPNNLGYGDLEDFCRMLAEPEAMTFAESCVKAAQEKGHTHFPEARLAKAQIHTYLAWQEEPGKPLGQSITARALKADGALALRFVAWLRRLFVDEVDGSALS